MSANYMEEMKFLAESTKDDIERSEVDKERRKEEWKHRMMTEVPMHVERIKSEIREFTEKFIQTKDQSNWNCSYSVHTSVEAGEEIVRNLNSLGFKSVSLSGRQSSRSGPGYMERIRFLTSVNKVSVDMSFLWK